MTKPAAAKKGRLRLMLAVGGVVIIVVAALLWLNRKTLAREALTGWLRSKGVASEAEVYAVGPTTFTGRLRIGDPARPDFTAARAEVRYRLNGFGFEVVSVTLREPVLRASVRDGRLSVGALDPIVEEFRRRPPRPDARKPRIAVDDGVLLLATDYGPVRMRADARVEDNKLMWLAASGDPVRLRGPNFVADLGRSALTVATRDGRTSVRLDAPVTSLASGDLSLSRALLRMTGDVPYPDLQKRRGDGRLVLNARITGQALAAGERRLKDLDASAAFVGEATGWITDLTVAGRAVADLRAGSGELDGTRAGVLRAALTSDDFRWTRRGGDRVSGTLRLTGALDRAEVADLTLQHVAVAFSGPAVAAKDGFSLSLAGSAVGRGGWSGLGAPTREDSADIVAVKRAARSFRVAAPGLRIVLAPGASPAVRLPRPLSLRPDAGGEVRVASLSGDAWRVTAAGGGLPTTDATLRNVAFSAGAASADLALKTRLSIGPMERGDIDAAGRLRIANGATTFAASRCAVVQAERLEFGANDVERLAGRLCPSGDPLFSFAGGDWRIAGRAEAVRAEVPFLQARIEDASGRAVFGLARGRLHAVAAIAAARVEDSAPEPRFNPLAMTGRAELAREVWRSELALRTPAGQPVATAKLWHEVQTGQGGVDLDTGTLTFAEGGLQPAQLSPLAAAIGSPATGQARFTGGFAWNLAAGISAGVVDIPRLDFQSPAGRVTGLSGKVVLTSLAPLVAAPGQALKAERVDAFAPLTHVTATFALKDEKILISGGEAEVGGGKVRVESLELPLARDAATKGVLLFEGVQLHDIVEASPFGDKVELDAKVTGRVPFEATGNRVRILGGDLKAIQPGRLSIRREAIVGVEADGAVEAPGAIAPPAAAEADTITDFAYQAMENLAFDQLDASINSRPDGRMGVLFHIRGRHDPPTRQEIRLGLMQLIQRKFLGKHLPLPSGTGVNLTLDTTLNLDDLLADYAEYQRLRSSGSVQP